MIEGVERARIERLDPFDIELDDGTRVRVEIGKQLWIAPGTSRGAAGRRLRTTQSSPRALPVHTWRSSSGENASKRELDSTLVERVLSKGTFYVDRAGTSFEVRPEGARWGSAVSMRLQGKDARRRTEKHVVPVGCAILIAGNAVRDPDAKSGTFAATGAESLLFFAAGRGKSARVAARRLLWIRRALFAAAVVSGGAGAALARWVEPQLPPFYMPDTD